MDTAFFAHQEPMPALSSQARLRLLCFPPAGAGASLFRGWRTALTPGIEVCGVSLPGRDDRWNEPALTKMGDLVERLVTDLHPLLNRPFALFGHSMGALVAFEFARQLARTTSDRPVHLFVSAFRAPQIPDPEPPISHLPDAQLLHRLSSLNGFAPEVLSNQEFIQAILPTLRADMAVCDGYRLSPGPLLDCPISAFGGHGDHRAPAAHVAAWRAQTTGRFRLRFFPGDHFFITSAQEQVLHAIAGELAVTAGV